MDLQWDELIVPNPSDVQIFNMDTVCIWSIGRSTGLYADKQVLWGRIKNHSSASNHPLSLIFKRQEPSNWLERQLSAVRTSAYNSQS